jgi:hypothetical protein
MPAKAGGTEDNTSNKAQNFDDFLKIAKIIAAPLPDYFPRFRFLQQKVNPCKQYSMSGKKFGWIGFTSSFGLQASGVRESCLKPLN